MMRVEFEYNRARVESLTFRVELELESSSSSSRAYSSRVLTEF